MDIILQNISYRAGDNPILHDISFTAASAELTCLVGPSGCGKSTILRLIAGLEKAQKGRIYIDGELVSSSDYHKEAMHRKVGLVFQHPSLFPHLNIMENVTFGLSHMDKEMRVIRAMEMLEMVGLSQMAKRYPHQLSGGQHQRIALARALAPMPKVMLLDEPFANLDYALRRDIREEVVAMLRSSGIPIIMVTHEPEEALFMADQMILLNKDGYIHQIGSPDAIHNSPHDVVAAEFFGPINKVRGIIKNGIICSKLGDLPAAQYAPYFEDGQQVIVATRPEGLRMARSGDLCVEVCVEDVRHTGAGWLVMARLPEGEKVRFHHIYGVAPEINSTVCIAFEPPHI